MIRKNNYKLMPALFIVLIVGYLYMNFNGINSFVDTSSKENIESVRASIENAVLQCYALEGHYPPNIQYLKENYSIIINEDAYIYHYDIEASNIMPTVLVFKKWKDKWVGWIVEKQLAK